MLLDMTAVAVLLTFGNVKFRRFNPQMPLWRRAAKVIAAVAVAGVLSHYFGRPGVIIALAIAALPVIYVHGIWLPRHGVNGWTGEPRERYYALRGWTRPQ